MKVSHIFIFCMDRINNVIINIFNRETERERDRGEFCMLLIWLI